MSAPDRLAVVVLAAGEGTRMKSSIPKVMHGFAGRSMLGHVLAATGPLHPAVTVVVVGYARTQVVAHLAQIGPDARAAVQENQFGTADAVHTGLDALADVAFDTVLVLPGDAPLLRTETLADLLAQHSSSGAAATMLTSRVIDPAGYGRVLRGSSGAVEGIVEHKDASEQELTVDEISALVYAFDASLLPAYLARVGNENTQGEFYLPDVIGLLRADGHLVLAVLASAEQTAGVNDRVQLAWAARVYRDRLIEEHQRAGVSFLDPATAWVDASVRLDQDVTIHPGVQLHGYTSIGGGSVIGPDCTLTDTIIGPGCSLNRVVAVGARVGAGVSIGPFAYLRPGTDLADDVHIGTYVELKNSDVGARTKIPHLSYVGDASIGSGTNIGAATVFVNYDGVAKHRTRIGNDARTGADNMFVAPVSVGDGAYTAAGSIITDDVPAGALAVARARQRNVPGWVQRSRPGTEAAKAAEGAEGADNPTDPNESGEQEVAKS